MMYLPESRPRVGFKPTTPFIAEGQMMEPSVSVPMATGARPAATAAPLPALEPQGVRSSTCGFLVRPPTALQPLVELRERKLAHSLKLVLPRMIAPAARKLAMMGASRCVTLLINASEPAVVGIGSADSMLSFTSTGMPCRGPRGPLVW